MYTRKKQNFVNFELKNVNLNHVAVPGFDNKHTRYAMHYKYKYLMLIIFVCFSGLTCTQFPTTSAALRADTTPPTALATF